jgi:hypothetical protein
VNAVKDFIKEKAPDLVNKIYKNNFDPYLYTVGIGSLMTPFDEEIPKYFDFLLDDEVKLIKDLILKTKDEDHKGVILKFSTRLKENFDLSDATIAGQSKILLSSPLTVDYLSSIELLGKYEEKQLKLLTKELDN